MGFLDGLKHQLLDIIEWTDNTSDTLVWRFPRYENEIKYGAKLIVRESQAAAFINEGKLADVYGPGTYTLQTQNMPVLSTLRGWKYGFASPFKAEVYFVNMRTVTDRKWGTKNPIMMPDEKFGMVRLRAFGSYAIRISDPAALLRQVAGTESRFTIDEIENQLRDLIVSRFADALGANKISALELAGNYDRIGRLISAQIQPDFTTLGIQIVNLLVENISLPPEVEAAMDKRTSMGVLGNMQAYTQYQVANSIPDAAANPGGLAGSGAGIAMGYAMANQVAGSFNAAGQANSGNSNSADAPPPLPKAAAYFAAIGGKQAGPFDAAALSDKIKSGQISRDTLVWKTGMSAWQKAGENAEISAMFQDAPPPLPQG